MLGQDGYLQILNEAGDILIEVNQETKVGDNGVYEFIYDDEINNIINNGIKLTNIKNI